jgi:hypothetical protein
MPGPPVLTTCHGTGAGSGRKALSHTIFTRWETESDLMGTLLGGIFLLLLAAFMLLGFVRSGAALSSPATIVALLVVVVLPAIGGVALLRSRGRTRGALDTRRDDLRRRTIDAEVIRLAGERAGRLTVLELVTELALSPEEAKDTLNDLMRRDVADIEVTDAGAIVYRFPDVQGLDDKHRARGLLDG